MIAVVVLLAILWGVAAAFIAWWVVCGVWGWVRETYLNIRHPTVYHYRKPYEKGDPWP